MINLGGDILKWVFGTGSNTDLVNPHSRLQTFASERSNRPLHTTPSYHGL